MKDIDEVVPSVAIRKGKKERNINSNIYKEAVEKNKMYLKVGFGEKNDPRLDSFVDYLVANKVDKKVVESAIVEQFAIIDRKDQPECFRNYKSYDETQKSAKKMIEKMKTGRARELSDWHECYALFISFSLVLTS